MSRRIVTRYIPAVSVSEGAGVNVLRTIGTPPLRHLDPFLMLDHFSSDQPDDYIAGFPDHPHRGFVTLTYMLDGHMLHQDSMGNRGDLRAGGVQWMKAASGVIHSEMPQQTEGLMRGFQLWVNLPAREKMSDPAYQEFSPGAVPDIEEREVRVRLISGNYAGQHGPVADPHSDVQYLDVALAGKATFLHTIDPGYSAFVYVFEGDATIGDRTLPLHNLALLGSGGQIQVKAGPTGARFLLVAGQPLREPIIQWGPFVMSTRREIEQALTDLRDDRLVRKKANITGG